MPVRELESLTECPDSMVYIWKHFIMLNNKRTSNGYGPNPLQYSELLAYFQLFQDWPDDWEIEMIMKLDSVFLDTQAAKAEKDQKQNEMKNKKPKK